jgi:hypothetical protein
MGLFVDAVHVAPRSAEWYIDPSFMSPMTDKLPSRLMKAEKPLLVNCALGVQKTAWSPATVGAEDNEGDTELALEGALVGGIERLGSADGAREGYRVGERDTAFGTADGDRLGATDGTAVTA